jgi:hypothetical protein
LFLSAAFLIGLATFSLIFVLSKNEFGLATGLGLFAIFGILRYRTEQVPIVEMTYIFLSITISIINAIADNVTLNIIDATIINASMILLSALFFWLNQRAESIEISITIDSVEWLEYSEEDKISFLETRSKNKIKSYQIESINWLKETCRVKIKSSK